MARRDLNFRDFYSLVEDVQRLHDRGYHQAGQWDLAQVCGHLTIAFEQSLDGFTFKGPWVVRKLVAPFIRRDLFRKRKIKAGLKAPDGFVVDPGTDEEQAVNQFLQMIDRIKGHRGGFHLHPFFEKLNDDQWLQFHLIHAAHHLSFLVPKQ